MTPKFHLLILATTAALLAGCRGIATKEEKSSREQVRSVGDTYRPDGKKPALPELTTNSSLGDFLTYAMLNQPSVEAGYFDWAASVERITIDRSLPDPQLTFESDIADVVQTVMPGFMQEFPGPGKLKARARVASAESQAKYFNFESAVLQTAGAVKRAYYQLWFLGDKIRLDRQTLELLADLESIARAKNEVGKVTLQDVYRAQIEQDRLTTEIKNLEDSQHRLIVQLKGALGLPHESPDPPSPGRFETTPLEMDGEQVLTNAFAHNPRLKQMEADIRTAEAAIALARKSNVPDFNLGLMVDAKASPTMFRPLAGMTLPIWRDKIAAEIAAAQANKRAAEARWSAEQIQLMVDFTEMAHDYREVTRNLALLQDQLIPKAWQSLEIARAGYLAGRIDFFNLMNAQRTWLDFQLEQVNARTRREIILTELSLTVAGIAPKGAPLLPAAGVSTSSANH